MKYLFLGPCRNRKDPSRIGGIVVLFEDWLEQCRAAGVDFEVIDTNKANYVSVPAAYISILRQLWRKSKTAGVIMMHGTFNDYLYIGPVLERVARRRGLSYVLRKFAGNFDDTYNKSNAIQRRTLRRVIENASISYWETQRLTQWAEKISVGAKWFPNVRSRVMAQRPPEPYSRRFVFISTVNKGKGIDVMIDAFRQLGPAYRLDIFGPLQDGYTSDSLAPFYKRSLDPGEIAEVLADHDVILLPTMWVTEGYPGIILEGLAVGVPAIASRLGGIPEIIADGENGVTFSPVTADNLIAAIRRFETLDYAVLSANARSSFVRFDTEAVTPQILEQIGDL